MELTLSKIGPKDNQIDDVTSSKFTLQQKGNVRYVLPGVAETSQRVVTSCRYLVASCTELELNFVISRYYELGLIGYRTNLLFSSVSLPTYFRLR